ncbi:uncharacterized protein LOC133187976 [Saccostrea echinata]|uniref:uncharacterized protein LOC133187976 n=1 Tax=Saccostrea echinata TaxID=191078 RepID=UPI002A80A9BE|nr:uncharacterized protein LOC133187976 [Saccostrea echinata]
MISPKAALSSSMMLDNEKLPEYSYSFGVYRVEECPMNQSEWEVAAERRQCNKTHGYHCAPDKYHSTLIEFCYTKKRILIHTGNCVELAADGILNHVKCQNFTNGCPEKPYYSNELYTYPNCMSLAIGCFTSDKECLKERFNKLQGSRTIKQTTEGIPVYLIALPVLICFVVVIVLIFIFRRKVSKINQREHNGELEETENLNFITEDFQVSPIEENQSKYFL